MTNFFIFTALILIAISVWQITKIFELSQTKKVNNQITNPAQYNEIKKSIARLYTTIKNSK